MSHSQVLRTHWWRNKSKTKFLLCAGAGVQTDREPTWIYTALKVAKCDEDKTAHDSCLPGEGCEAEPFTVT